MPISTFLDAVPAVVWSGLGAAVITATITFTGLFITNKQSARNIDKQLKNSSDEKEKDRKAELRREIYLSAAEESVAASHHLALLPTLDL